MTSGLVAMETKLGSTLMGKVPQLQHQHVIMTVVIISEENISSEEKDEKLLDLQNELKAKETEINLSNQVKKLNQELDEMMENDEELKILHQKKLLSSTESQGKSHTSELNKHLVITEKKMKQTS
ncbi:hypothetical protein TNCV_1968891 [Trichonephila clavipes]|nr:hypothetical protein TNCV_1968891 [Trichonephila clavipes]